MSERDATIGEKQTSPEEQRSFGPSFVRGRKLRSGYQRQCPFRTSLTWI